MQQLRLFPMTKRWYLIQWEDSDGVLRKFELCAPSLTLAEERAAVFVAKAGGVLRSCKTTVQRKI